MKFEYSFSVKRLPPPSAGHTIFPPSTMYPGPYCPRIVQPFRSLPLKIGTKPGSSAAATNVRTSRRENFIASAYRMDCNLWSGLVGRGHAWGHPLPLDFGHITQAAAARPSDFQPILSP